MVRQTLIDPRSAWRGTLAGLIAGGVVALVFMSGTLLGPYTALQDRLFPAVPPAQQVTLVAIDQKSENTLGTGAWPWGNDYHARVIRNLAALKPTVLVLDIVFDHLTGPRCNAEGVSGIDALAVLQNCGSQVVDTDSLLVKALIDARAAGVPVVIACSADDAPLPIFVDAATGELGPGTAPGYVGDRGLGQPDPANAVRSVPVRRAQTCAANRSGESVFVAALRVVEGDNRPLAIGTGVATIGSRQIPLAASANEMLINFSTGKSPTCSYVEAYNAGCKSRADLITGRIVVVGIKVLDAGDIHAQPVSFTHDGTFCPLKQPQCLLPNENYGYRILGDEIGTVLEGRYLHLQPDLSIVLAALLLGAVIGTQGYLLPFRRGTIVTVIAVVAYAVGAVLLAGVGYLADPLFTPAAMVLAFVATLAARYVLEERERRKLEGLFARYVDRGVLSQLVRLESADKLQVGGERRELTVLFVDVRGFTTASERLPAEEVLALLNEFTDRCTKIIFEHDGTVDKYIGDCVMAFWNAPQRNPRHADAALEAAIAIIRDPRSTGPLGPLGVGLCSGEAVVGFVGGETRVSYTAIGDTVNTASRLCSAAPARTVLVAGSTWDLLTSRPPAEELEPLHVKGREALVPVLSITVDELATT